MAPMPWWWGGGYNPPELVAENEVEIGPDGRVYFVDLKTSAVRRIEPGAP